MATREIPAQTIVTDDFNGKDITADDAPVKVEITVKINGKPAGNGKPATLDTAETIARKFAAFVSDPTDENRRAFGDIVPRTRVGSASGNSTGGRSKDVDANGVSKRDWLRANGHADLGVRGKFTTEQDDAWHKHTGSNAVTAPVPAA